MAAEMASVLPAPTTRSVIREEEGGKPMREPRLTLTQAENDGLHRAFIELLEAVTTDVTNDQERLCGLLKSSVTEHSFTELTTGPAAHVFAQEQLLAVCAYSAFARKMLGLEGALEVQVRHEGWKSYALIPVEQSIVMSLPEDACLLWVHDEQWAQARFMDPDAADFGLCGQFLGKSKFVTAGVCGVCGGLRLAVLCRLDTR